MRRDLSRHKISIVLVIVIVVGVVALARSSVNLKNSKRSFREEMALRLDLEEKASVLERNREVLASELKSLKTELAKTKKEIVRLKSEVEKGQDENMSLKKELAEARKAKEASPAIVDQATP